MSNNTETIVISYPHTWTWALLALITRQKDRREISRLERDKYVDELFKLLKKDGVFARITANNRGNEFKCFLEKNSEFLKFTKEEGGNDNLVLKDGMSEAVLYRADIIGLIPARFWEYYCDLAGDVFNLEPT